MSKSVLVIDTPENCDKCKIRAINLAWCNVARKSTSHYTNGKPIDERKRQDWCPLRELPEKKEPTQFPISPFLPWQYTEYDKGWNDCIEKMEEIDE